MSHEEKFTRENIELMLRYMIKRPEVAIHPKVLRHHGFWYVSKPVCEEEGIIFWEWATVEDEEKFGAIWGGILRLERMRVAGGEVPQVTFRLPNG